MQYYVIFHRSAFRSAPSWRALRVFHHAATAFGSVMVPSLPLTGRGKSSFLYCGTSKIIFYLSDNESGPHNSAFLCTWRIFCALFPERHGAWRDKGLVKNAQGQIVESKVLKIVLKSIEYETGFMWIPLNKEKGQNPCFHRGFGLYHIS